MTKLQNCLIVILSANTTADVAYLI